jgi:hypothetical protein
MSCAITGGYTIDCIDNVGGIKNIYIIAFNEVASVTEASGLVTAITKTTAKRFYKIQLPQGVGEGKDTPTPSQENGSLFFTHSVTFPINKRDATIRNYVLALAKSRVMIVAEELNGEYKLYGKEFGMYLSDGSEGTSGVAPGDRNGYNLSFSGIQFSPVLQVNDATFATLETPG